MARPKNADPERSRTRLLDAAEHEFAERGFSGARMTSIARAAGMNHRMLHYYFRNKELLYEAVVERLFSRHLALAREQLAEQPTRRDFRAMVLRNFDLFWRYPNQVRIMLWEMASGEGRVERIAASTYDTVLAAAPELDPTRPANRVAEHDRRDVLVSLLGAVVVYFFSEPGLRRMFGDRRFGPADHERRRAHLGALVDLFF